MDEYHPGRVLTIWLWPGAQDSWSEAEALVPGHLAACPAQFRARLERLSDFGTLRIPDHMNSEGDGLVAVKATCGLRAWGWFDQVEKRRAFIISHVVMKRKQKADSKDLERARAAREQYRQAKR